MNHIISNITKISNDIKDEINNYEFFILDENENNIDYRHHTYYALVNALSLAYFFCVNSYTEPFTFNKFMKSYTIFDVTHIHFLYIQTKEDKENIIHLINDTISTYKYFNKKEYINNNNILSINPFYFGNDENYIIGTHNDKIVDILMNVINVIKTIIV
jgi:hypothetical protein